MDWRLPIKFPAASLAILLICALFSSGAAWADQPIPKELAEVSLVDRIGNGISLDLPFRDEDGQTVTLRQFFQPGQKRPVMIVPVYFTCPSLCTYTMNGVVQVLKKMSLVPGKDFELVVLSFDPAETPALAKEKKETYLKSYGKGDAADGWHFLTGDEKNISQLMGELGFRYTYDKENQQYRHSSATYVLSPSGTISRYFSSIYFEPNDLKLALVEASKGKVGSVIDKLVLFCAHYDDKTGQYTVVVMRVMQLMGLVTLTLLVGTIGSLILWERRQRRLAAARKPGDASPTAPPPAPHHPDAHGLSAR